MKTIQCECGEYIEITGINVCSNCHYIHHSTQKNEIKYRFHCPSCQDGFNGLVPICPSCNEWIDQPVKKYSPQKFVPLKFNTQPVIHVQQPQPKLQPKPEQEKPEHINREKPKSTFLPNLILGMFCFNTGLTAGNFFKYAVLKKIMRV
jgi:hypothetical protein